MQQRSVCLAALLACAAAVAQAPVNAPPGAGPGLSAAKTIRLLTVGNSFSGNATLFLGQIAASVPGCKIVIGRADIGGCSLDKHWALVEKSEADPECRPYKRGDTAYSLKQMLQLEPWDVVTLQQVSNKSFVEESYQPYADNLYAYIRKYAPQAQVMIHQTWAYATGNDRLKQWNMTPEQMYDGLAACYDKLAARLHCALLPSGAAFQLARQERPEIGLNDSAAYHANGQGCYLAGCAWFGALFGISPTTIAFVPKGIAAEEAEFLRRTAAEAVRSTPGHPAASKE